MIKKNKKSTIFSIIVGIGISLTITGSVLAISKPFRGNDKPPQYKVNSKGETYGSILDSVSQDTNPELISAVGENGKKGYVKNKDLNSNNKLPKLPSTPQDALRYNKEIQGLIKKAQTETGTNVIATIPLYDVDGTTVIGTFDIVGSQSAEGDAIDPNLLQ